MEAEYIDFMSIEIDEGKLDFSLLGLETRQNQLSSLSPTSFRGSDKSNSGNNEGRKSKVLQGSGADFGDFKARLTLCMPFEFAGNE